MNELWARTKKFKHIRGKWSTVRRHQLHFRPDSLELTTKLRPHFFGFKAKGRTENYLSKQYNQKDLQDLIFTGHAECNPSH